MRVNYETKESVMKYDFAAIEAKWQKKWEETKPYAAVTGDPRPKFYVPVSYTQLDVYKRQTLSCRMASISRRAG